MACCSGVIEPRGGLEARDLASLGGGVKLASDPPLNSELRSAPRTLLFDDPESMGPGYFSQICYVVWSEDRRC